MVKFVECDPPATDADVDELERKLGFRVPSGIRRLLTTANGGRPEPFVFGGLHGTDVSECLALRDGRGSIRRIYELVVLTNKAAPAHFLPFAVDSGGNFYLVDCSSEEATVHYLHHDPEHTLHPLGVGLEEFWDRLADVPEHVRRRST